MLLIQPLHGNPFLPEADPLVRPVPLQDPLLLQPGRNIKEHLQAVLAPAGRVQSIGALHEDHRYCGHLPPFPQAAAGAVEPLIGKRLPPGQPGGHLDGEPLVVHIAPGLTPALGGAQMGRQEEVVHVHHTGAEDPAQPLGGLGLSGGGAAVHGNGQPPVLRKARAVLAHRRHQGQQPGKRPGKDPVVGLVGSPVHITVAQRRAALVPVQGQKSLHVPAAGRGERVLGGQLLQCLQRLAEPGFVPLGEGGIQHAGPGLLGRSQSAGGGSRQIQPCRAGPQRLQQRGCIVRREGRVFFRQRLQSLLLPRISAGRAEGPLAAVFHQVGGLGQRMGVQMRLQLPGELGHGKVVHKGIHLQKTGVPPRGGDRLQIREKANRPCGEHGQRKSNREEGVRPAPPARAG